MRREELALVILGELDESFIDEAMPKKAAFSAGDDTVGGQRPKEFGEIAEVSKRDVRIYWITRALGMAAVVALIVGAVVLLVQNWDKIAVSGNDRPGEITDISEPVVTDSNKEPMIEEYRTGSIESNTVYGQSELFESVFYGSWEPVDVNNDADPLFLTYREDMFTFENFVYPYGITETDEIYVLPFVSDGAKECYLIKKSEPGYLYKGVWEPEGEYMSENLFTIDTVTGKYRRTEAYSDVREIRPGDEISVCGLHKILGNEKYRGNGISGRFYEEAFYTLPGGFYGGGFRVPGGFSGKGSFTDEYGTEWVIGNSKKLPASKMYYIGGDGEKTLTLALRYYKKTEYDAFTAGAGQGDIPIPQEQYFAITLQVDENGICRVNYKKAYEILLSTGNYTVSSDLSSDPFEQITDTSMPEPGINSMYSTWLDFSSPWKQRVSHVLLPLHSEQKVRGSKWVKSKESVPTPYNLYNSMSLVSFCHDLNIPWENIEDNVRAWDGSVRYPPGTPPEEYEDIERFTEDELSAMRNGDTEEIAKQFASEYSVIIGENVFSPKWLYYHTAEDYKAAGIDPYSMHSLLEKYSELGLSEEAWRAFRKKLILYAYSEMSPEKDRVYTYELDVSEPLGDDAFRIFEDMFCGEWEYAGKYDRHNATFDMTYGGTSFKFGRIFGIFETDEIYVLHFNDGAGVLECYVIEKSAPDIMYNTDVLTSLGGIEEIKLGDDEPVKYINRKPAAAELKPGDLSIPGLTYLFHLYGSDFEEYYRAVMERDGYQSISEDEPLYLSYGYTADEYRRYLVDMSENSVTIALPYVHDNRDTNQTSVYYELTFTKDESGEWSVEYQKADIKVYSPI